MGILKRIFCKHEYEFLSNIPGPQRQFCGWNCTVYECKKCGNQKFYKDYIYKKYDWDELKEITEVKLRYLKRDEHIKQRKH